MHHYANIFQKQPAMEGKAHFSEQAALHKSIEAVKEELGRCAQLDIPYLVLHPGSKLNADENSALEQIASSLDSILEASDGQTMILLEIMAGQGSSICYTFEQLGQVIRSAKHKRRLGVCFDTCHAFAAGYDFSTPKGYEEMWKHFDKTIGLNNLKAIHLNDSKKESGSRVDRHEEIGEGKIGMKAFELLMNDENLFDVPKVLETPKDDLKDYAKNMKALEALLSKKNRELLGL
jgi:deoxyribonuclease-4